MINIDSYLMNTMILFNISSMGAGKRGFSKQRLEYSDYVDVSLYFHFDMGILDNNELLGQLIIEEEKEKRKKKTITIKIGALCVEINRFVDSFRLYNWYRYYFKEPDGIYRKRIMSFDTEVVIWE